MSSRETGHLFFSDGEDEEGDDEERTQEPVYKPQLKPLPELRQRLSQVVSTKPPLPETPPETPRKNGHLLLDVPPTDGEEEDSLLTGAPMPMIFDRVPGMPQFIVPPSQQAVQASLSGQPPMIYDATPGIPAKMAPVDDVVKPKTVMTKGGTGVENGIPFVTKAFHFLTSLTFIGLLVVAAFLLSVFNSTGVITHSTTTYVTQESIKLQVNGITIDGTSVNLTSDASGCFKLGDTTHGPYLSWCEGQNGTFLATTNGIGCFYLYSPNDLTFGSQTVCNGSSVYVSFTNSSGVNVVDTSTGAQYFLTNGAPGAIGAKGDSVYIIDSNSTSFTLYDERTATSTTNWFYSVRRTGANATCVNYYSESTGITDAICKGDTGTSTFTALTDCPASYSGQATKVVRVNSGATGLEFVSASSIGVTAFTGLSDVPASYSGQGTKVVRVNSGETALEFVAASSVGTTTFTGLTDAPSSYSGQGSKYVAVKSDATGLEFVTPSTSSGGSTTIPVNGGVVQVKSAVLTSATTFNTNAALWQLFPGMNVTITPSSTSSNISLQFSGVVSSSVDNGYAYIRLKRNNTLIAMGDTAGSAQRCWIDASMSLKVGASYAATTRTLSAVFVDSPATTSPITYSLEVLVTHVGPMIIGRTYNTDDGNRAAVPTQLVVSEVAPASTLSVSSSSGPINDTLVATVVVQTSSGDWSGSGSMTADNEIRYVTTAADSSYMEYAFGTQITGSYYVVYQEVCDAFNGLINLEDRQNFRIITYKSDSYCPQLQTRWVRSPHFYRSAGALTLRWSVEGKNNASTGYYHILANRIYLYRTTGGGVAAFTQLSDAPSTNYSGHANKAVVVNSGETALEFRTLIGFPYAVFGLTSGVLYSSTGWLNVNALGLTVLRDKSQGYFTIAGSLSPYRISLNTTGLYRIDISGGGGGCGLAPLASYVCMYSRPVYNGVGMHINNREICGCYGGTTSWHIDATAGDYVTFQVDRQSWSFTTGTNEQTGLTWKLVITLLDRVYST